MQLRFVHQQSSTFPDLTVAENIALGHGFEVGLMGRIRWAAMRRRTAAILTRFAIDVAPDDRVTKLSSAMQMMVAIARALQDQDEAQEAVLVLDEPTASLPAHEVDVLLSALQQYAASGHTILYVTHRLGEVVRTGASGTVLRDGRVVGTFAPGEIDQDELVTLMMGQPIERVTGRGARTIQQNRVVMRAAGLGAGAVRIELRAGEVLGLAGILGAGQSTLLRQLFGALPMDGGTLELDGSARVFRGPRDAMRAGIGYVPEDRAREALFADLSIAENLSVSALDAHARFGYMSMQSERRKARDLIDTFQVTTPSEATNVASLSGGNQQKVVLARWLQSSPKVLLLDEPTQGVDVAARAEIHHLVRQAVDSGTAVILVSSDFEELAAACDRVLVLRNGCITAELTGGEIDEDRITASVYAATLD
jgi:ribose transport system ATP-binding protein